MDCARTVAALGRDESSRVDLVIRDLDVYRINAVVESLRQDLELVEVRKSLEFVEIRGRLQDAELKLALRQSVPNSLQSLSFSGAERDGWCWRCHLRSICLPDLECRSSWCLGCERQDVSEAN